MVRTYAISALTQSSDNIFNNNPTRRGTWNQEQFQDPPPQAQWNNRHQTPPEDPIPSQTQNRPYVQDIQQTSAVPLPVQSYNMPSFLHSPYVDPVGSIIGLRVVYSEGKITYIPVEPHINYMINQQYGVPTNTPPQMVSPNSNSYQQQPPQQPQQYQQPQYQHQKSQQQLYKPYPQQQEPPVQQRQRQQQYSRTDSERWLPNRVDTPASVQSMPAQQAQREPQHAVRRRSNEMNGDFWFPSNPQPRSGVRRSREWSNEVDTDYNPWGRGGGGSPLKDSMGNLVTDRRLLGRSWSTMLTTNLPHALDKQPRSAPESFLSSSRNEYPSYPAERTRNRMPSFAPMAVSSSMPNLNKTNMSDADIHRMELQKQIEDNRRKKELEKQKEKEIEDMEIRKHEEYMARMQRQEEEEKRRQREQAILAERRSEQIYQEQQERARQAKRRSPPPRQRTPIRRDSQERYERPRQDPQQQERYERAPEPYIRPERPDSAAPRELEWWEKKPTWQQKAEDDSRKSAVIPALRGKPPPSRASSASRTASRQSQQRYDPSSSIQEHEEGREREQMEREAASARSQRSASRRSASVQREDSRDDARRTIEEEPSRMATPVNFGQNVSNDARGRPTAFVIQ